MYQKDIEVLAKKSNLSEDEIEKVLENIKCIFKEIANQFKELVHQPGILSGIKLATKVAMDKELNHYVHMHRRVKSKRLKKKYEKKFDQRLNEMKSNLDL